MKKFELEVEHRYQNKFVGRHRLKGEQSMTTLGSSREADIRLLGEGVSGIHASIELDEKGNWILTDLVSESGTWVKKKPILAKEIHSTTNLRIGGHHIKLVPKVLDHEIFQRQIDNADDVEGQLKYHQIVVRKLGWVVNTALVPEQEGYEFSIGGESYNIKPTDSMKWEKIEFSEDVVLQHRLVYSHEVNETVTERFQSAMDSGLKVPVVIALSLLFVMGSLLLLAPRDQAPDLAELKPQENKYTRMIFDAKAVRKKRDQAQRSRKQIAGRSQAANPNRAPASAQTPAPSKAKPGSATAKVVTKLKAAGLSQLLGKISSRRAKVARFIKTTGKTANNPGLGRVTASVGALGKGKVGNSGAAKGKFKISGVSTAGKAGGSASYRGIGGLAAGGVGNSMVGVLEEETDVQGGLEKDVIARVIQGQIGQIRYCYERQLSANPDLYGKVLVKFTIGSTGSVETQNVGLTTLNSAMVEGCILRRVAKWKFPKPKGGTSVMVTYPFLFKSTN